jgi:hypothetical protein
MADNAPASRAALHGSVTAFVVTLRVLAAIAATAADVLTRIAEVIAAGRTAPKSAPSRTGQLSLTTEGS